MLRYHLFDFLSQFLRLKLKIVRVWNKLPLLTFLMCSLVPKRFKCSTFRVLLEYCLLFEHHQHHLFLLFFHPRRILQLTCFTPFKLTLGLVYCQELLPFSTLFSSLGTIAIENARFCAEFDNFKMFCAYSGTSSIWG